MKKKILLTFLGFIILVMFTSLFINIYMIKCTEKHIVDISDINNIEEYDAILVLGCKAYVDHPSEMLEERLDKAIELYHDTGLKILVSGDHGKNDYDEVNVMKEYLIDEGIPREDIFLDHAGFSTYDSIYRAKNIFDIEKMIIVTQEYHLYRALYLAECLDIDAVGVKARDLPYKSIMVKNEIREIFSRDKNFFKGIFKPKSKYLGDKISLNQSGLVTEG